MSSEHITHMVRSKCFLAYSCLALAMRDVFVNFVALLTRNAVSKRCVLADLYTWFIYNTLCNRLKLAGSSHILTKFMDAQRRNALFFVTQGVGCVSCMCDWGIRCHLSSAASEMGFGVLTPCIHVQRVYGTARSSTDITCHVPGFLVDSELAK